MPARCWYPMHFHDPFIYQDRHCWYDLPKMSITTVSNWQSGQNWRALKSEFLNLRHPPSMLGPFIICNSANCAAPSTKMAICFHSLLSTHWQHLSTPLTTEDSHMCQPCLVLVIPSGMCANCQFVERAPSHFIDIPLTRGSFPWAVVFGMELSGNLLVEDNGTGHVFLLC